MFTLKTKEKVQDRFTDSISLQKKADEIRLLALESITRTGARYVGSCMSVIDILVALYRGKGFSGSLMNYEKEDKLVFSKGHAATALYAVLASLNFFDKSELASVGAAGAMLTSRPSSKIPGVFASVNTVGSGLSIGVGMALSQKMEKNNGRTFVVMGDGELQNGQVWEAALFASHNRLDNLTVMIDNNRIQSGHLVSGVVDVGSIQDKFEAFGWKVIQVGDGHDYDKVMAAVEKAKTISRRPVCVWCRTISGKGIPFAEAKESYHASELSEGELQAIKEQL